MPVVTLDIAAQNPTHLGDPSQRFTMQRALSSTGASITATSAGAEPFVDDVASVDAEDAATPVRSRMSARLEAWCSHLGLDASDAMAVVGDGADVDVAAHSDNTHDSATFYDNGGYDDAIYDDEQYGDDIVLAGGGGRRWANSGGGSARSNRKRIDGKTSVYSSKHVRRQEAIRAR